MCVIVHKQKDVSLSEQVLQECWNENPHGAGIMWAENKKLFFKKGFMTFSDLWSYISNDNLDFKNKECIIHFRYATTVLKTPDLCHPFIINPNLAFVHNGILSYPEMDDPMGLKSDTQLLCLKILKQLPWNFLNNRGISLLLENYFQGSIFVFMDNDGKVTKLGETDNGVEIDGYWFSNYYWSKDLFKKTMMQSKRYMLYEDENNENNENKVLKDLRRKWETFSTISE